MKASEVDEILAKAEAKSAQPSVQQESAEGDGSESEKSDGDDDADAGGMAHADEDGDLSLEVGGVDLSQIQEGDPTVQGEAAAVEQMGAKEIKMEMKKVQDPKTGVIAKLRECMAKLDKIYLFLEEEAGGVELNWGATSFLATALRSDGHDLTDRHHRCQYKNAVTQSRSQTPPHVRCSDFSGPPLTARRSWCS